MSTITKELAKLFRKITNSEIDAEGNAHVVLSPADSLLINNARIALASLEAEPVAFVKSGYALCYYRPPSEYGLKIGDKLYAAAQPATVVPDAIPKLKDDQRFKYVKDGIRYSVSYANGWNACRAAMLQGKAEPVSKPYKLAEGWVAVHTEIPPQGEPLLICTSEGVVQWTTYGFDGENWLDWGKLYDPVKVDRCDLWQRMPAAPQQEAE